MPTSKYLDQTGTIALIGKIKTELDKKADLVEGKVKSDQLPANIDTSVKLSSPLKCYYKIGKVNGSATNPVQIGGTGDSLRTVLNNIFVMDEVQPSAPTQPSISFTLPSSAEYGTKISSLDLTVTPNAGSYEYGPATGVTFSQFTATDGTATATSSTESVTLTLSSTFTVGLSSAVDITVTGTHSAGATAKTNLGNASNPAVAISADTVNKTVALNPTPLYYVYYAVGEYPSSPPAADQWTRANVNGTDIQIQAAAGKYIWFAYHGSGLSIYEFNDVSGSYNTEATATTDHGVGYSNITLDSGAAAGSVYRFIRTTNARSGATDKKFKLA